MGQARPYIGQRLRSSWRYLCAKGGLPADVEFAHIRDGAYTSAIDGGADGRHCLILKKSVRIGFDRYWAPQFGPLNLLADTGKAVLWPS